MGTRGAFGVIINEQEKITYSHFDSYPDGKGIEALRWLRQSIADGELENLRALAEAARVIDEDKDKPTAEDKERLAAYTNTDVNTGSEDDWYVLTRELHGDFGALLQAGYFVDWHNFPLDSLFCEWAYIVDFDRGVFEVYAGFQQKVPLAGRWKGRPTPEEDAERYAAHLEYAKAEGREPWQKPESEFKAVELVASWPFNNLPSDEYFLGTFELLRARELLADADEYPEDAAVLYRRIQDEGLTSGPFAADWQQIEAELRAKITPGDVARIR